MDGHTTFSVHVDLPNALVCENAVALVPAMPVVTTRTPLMKKILEDMKVRPATTEEILVIQEMNAMMLAALVQTKQEVTLSSCMPESFSTPTPCASTLFSITRPIDHPPTTGARIQLTQCFDVTR